jgi:hypothetical protein
MDIWDGKYSVNEVIEETADTLADAFFLFINFVYELPDCESVPSIQLTWKIKEVDDKTQQGLHTNIV